jgi:hypothetical protein
VAGIEPRKALRVIAGLALATGAAGGFVPLFGGRGDASGTGGVGPGRHLPGVPVGLAAAHAGHGRAPCWHLPLTPVGAALREAYEREPVDGDWTQETRSQLGPLLFSNGFELECRASWCALETTFASGAAFRDFTDSAFGGRAPTWAGSYVLASRLPAPSGQGANADVPLHVVLFLGDRRRAAAGAVPGTAAPTQVTSGMHGVPGAGSDARGWSKRTTAGSPAGIMQNTSGSQFRELVVQLGEGRSEPADSAPLGSWRVFVSVGGPDLAQRPARCTVQQHAAFASVGAVLVASSGPETYDATYDASIGTIELLLPAASEARETFVRCSVPPQGWVGNITWQHAALEPAGQASRPPGSVASNSEG